MIPFSLFSSQMKNYFSRLFCIENYLSINYAFKVKDGLCRLSRLKNKRTLGAVCLLERDSYWQAERHYNNINIFDLPKLMKAEAATIAPFAGSVFWKINKINSTQATIVYFAVPAEYIEAINKECQFVYPLGIKESFPENELNFTSLEITSHELDNSAIDVSAKNVFNLAGFYVAKPKSEAHNQQRLSLKQLSLISSACIVLFTLLSSVYLSLNLSYYESKVIDNNIAVEQALKSQRELKTKYKSKQDFDTFAQNNSNVLALLSDFSFKDEKYSIQRIHLHSKGVKITGTSETSATNLLAILLKQPTVSEAKFSRAVSKNRSGEDVFVIEVVFS